MSAERKRCTKCGKEKPRSEFHDNKRTKDGKKARCAVCERKATRDWHVRNRERVSEYNKQYRAENIERITEQKKQWRADNPEYGARWRIENRERQAATHARWYAENREHKLAQNAKWKAENPERWAEHTARGSARRRAREANCDRFPYVRAEIFARWGAACTYCDSPATALDHVTPIAKGGADAEWNLVPACTPCNSSKGAKTLAEWAATF